MSSCCLLRLRLKLGLGVTLGLRLLPMLGLRLLLMAAAALLRAGSRAVPALAPKLVVGLGRNRGDVINLHPSGVDRTVWYVRCRRVRIRLRAKAGGGARVRMWSGLLTLRFFWARSQGSVVKAGPRLEDGVKPSVYTLFEQGQGSGYGQCL